MSSQTSQILKVVTIFFMLFSVVALGYVGWRERQPIIEKLTGPKVRATAARVPNPGDVSIKEFQQFADSQPWIEGINIVKVDFIQNTRQTTYRYFKTQAIVDSWNEYSKKFVRAPLFGPNEVSNQRIVNLINGQSNCVPVMQTAAGQVIPRVKDFVTDVCAVAIPPGYGDFIGFINIFMQRKPTAQEIQFVLKRAEKLSLEMYERDVVKSNRKFSDLGSSNVIR